MWLTALTLGFAGSLHCVGMCSPLVLAATGMHASAWGNRLLYNGGRVLSYSILGALIAGMGMMLPLHNYQNLLSIALGVTLLAIGVGGLPAIRLPVFIHQFTGKLKAVFARHLQKKNRGAMFVMGMINGLLPCGLTLIALTWCLTLRGPMDGFNFMLLFGAGTLPAMVGLPSLLPLWFKRKKINFPQVTTYMFIASGCLLIARGFFIHAPHTTSGDLMEIILCR